MIKKATERDNVVRNLFDVRQNSSPKSSLAEIETYEKV